jgi:hypothetical protein
MARDQNGQMRMGKERFQFLNRWIGQDGITYPIYSPHQNAVHMIKFGFQGILSLLKLQKLSN